MRPGTGAIVTVFGGTSLEEPHASPNIRLTKTIVQPDEQHPGQMLKSNAKIEHNHIHCVIPR